jgi:hypothetical protein
VEDRALPFDRPVGTCTALKRHVKVLYYIYYPIHKHNFQGLTIKKLLDVEIRST